MFSRIMPLYYALKTAYLADSVVSPGYVHWSCFHESQLSAQKQTATAEKLTPCICKFAALLICPPLK